MNIQIKEITIEPVALDVMGNGPLRGEVTVSLGDQSFIFPLSLASIDTIKECVERDYDEAIRKMTPCE